MPCFLVLILQGCSTSPAKESKAPTWLSEHMAYIEKGVEYCQPPVGVFSVHGSTSSDAYVFQLQEILFEDRLAGYPVEQVQISELADGPGLSIRGVLAAIPLDKAIAVSTGKGACEERWYLKVDTRAVNSQLRTEAILWTGGLLIPLRETNHLYLHRAQDGALIIHMHNKAWILGALSIPFVVRNELWLRYPGVVPQNGQETTEPGGGDR